MKRILAVAALSLLSTTASAQQVGYSLGPLAFQGNSPTVTGKLTAAQLATTGNLSAASWTTNGLRVVAGAATLANTTSTGTVATIYGDLFGAQTLTASSSTIYTNAIGTFFSNPIASTNVTATNKWAIGAESARLAINGGGNLLRIDNPNNSNDTYATVSTTGGSAIFGMTSTSGFIQTGAVTTPFLIDINAAVVGKFGATSAPAWTVNGQRFVLGANTYTDTTSSGTVASMVVDLFGSPTIAASSATTYTTTYSLWVQDAIAGTNATLTNIIGILTSSIRLTTRLIIDKTAASGTAPIGAGMSKFEVVCGTIPGTAKLIMYAGTSATPSTVVDSVGAGVTGC